MEKNIKTIEKECSIEFIEKKSKFIGYAKPVYSKEEAEDFIKFIKEKHKDATHNCSCYKIEADGVEHFKVDDDGEPSGTAGKPMGDILTYMGVTNLVVVATRYFGGIKLGAGGLVRAYAKTTKLAIQEAQIVDFLNKVELMFEFPYDKMDEISQKIEEYNYDKIEKSFLDRVIIKIKIEEKFLREIENLDYVSII